MTAVQRQNPQTLVLELTRRLAEEYASVPLSMVTATVNAARSATELFGETLPDSLPTIERIAREDLEAVRTAANEQAVAG